MHKCRNDLLLRSNEEVSSCPVMLIASSKLEGNYILEKKESLKVGGANGELSYRNGGGFKKRMTIDIFKRKRSKTVHERMNEMGGRAHTVVLIF